MKRPFTPSEDERLIDMRQKGFTLEAMGRFLGRSEGSVHGRVAELRKQGRLPNRPPPDLTGIDDTDLAWMAYWQQPRAVRRAQGGLQP